MHCPLTDFRLVLKWSLGNAQFGLPESRKLKYKTEYENFKLKLTLFSLVLSILNLWMIDFIPINIVHSFCSLYFYATITLREHILQVNGSRIRIWWIFHHYLSIILTGTLLIWPWGQSFVLYRPCFLLSCIYMAAIQYLQYRYQMTRLYALRALSKIGPMEVTTDSAQVHVRNNLAFLLPFLLIGHMIQLYNVYYLYQLWLMPNSTEWQIVVVALVFLLLALGNISTTLLTFYQKLQNNK